MKAKPVRFYRNSFLKYFKMNTLALSAVVLCLCLGFIHGQDKCLKPGAVMVNDQTAKLCYKANQVSVVQLKCDWVNFRFNLTVTPEKPAKEIVFKRQPLGYSSPSQGRADMEIATGNKACPANGIRNHTEVYSYLSQAPNVNISIVNGQVYYNTTVVIAEYHYIGETCQRQLMFITDVNVSCCADPERTPDKPIVPPLHQYCNLTICTINPLFECECQLGAGDQWEIRASNLMDFGELDNIDFHLDYVHTHSSLEGSSAPIFPVVENGNLAILHKHLEASAHPRPNVPGADYSVALNPFVFHDDHFNGVNITCKASLCVIDRSQSVSPHLSHLEECVKWESR